MYVRKAQYGWGWDWGPVLVTAGPWKPISVESYDCKVEELRVHVEMEEPYETPKLRASWEVVDGVDSMVARVQLVAPDGKVVRTRDVDVAGGKGEVEWSFGKAEVDLWWPHGHGKQPLYTVKIELLAEVRYPCQHFSRTFPRSVADRTLPCL